MASTARSGHGLGVALVLAFVLGVVALAGLERLDGSPPAVADKALAAGDIWIPAAAHATGAAGTNWRTDVEVHNPLAGQATYTVSLLRQDWDNTSPLSVTRSLAPGRSERLSDLLMGLFGYDGSAAIRLSVSGGGVIASSRTYNQVSIGTYGQFIAAVPDAQAIDYGEHGRVIQLTHNRSAASGFRTNLGFVSCSPSTIALRADFYRSDAVLLGSQSYTLQPFMYSQRNKAFESVTGGDVADGYVVLQTTTGGGRFLAYASVVDNRTGDPIYVPASVVAGGTTPPSPTPTVQGATPTRTASVTPTRTPTATPTQNAATVNLRPYQPNGWSGPLVASGTAGTTTSGGLVGGGTTYIDWALANDGPGDLFIPQDQVLCTVELDGQGEIDFIGPAGGYTLQAGYYAYYNDYALTSIGAGQHNLTLVGDPSQLFPETDEGDNSYTYTGTWSGKGAARGSKKVRVVVEGDRLQQRPLPRGARPAPADGGEGWWKLATLVEETVYVPAASHVAGASGTNWRTDLELHNPGSQQGQYEIALLRENQGNPVPQTATYWVAPGQCLRLEDVLLSVFGFNGNASLRVRPVEGSVLITSRTYNLTSGGTYGQFIAGFRESQAIGAGQEARLIQLTHNRSTSSGYRTNLGFVNVGGADVTVAVDLYDASGVLLGTRSYPLQPYMFQQVSRIFEQVTGGDVADGYAVVRSTAGGQPFFTYASVVDNATGDPIYVRSSRLEAGGTTPTPTRTPTRTPTQTPGAITVTVSPAQVTLSAGATQQFTATVTGTPNTAVTWSVQEGAAGGSITQGGLYTAPAALGTYHVRATSQADPSRFGTATVQVQEIPTGVVFGRTFSTGGETLAGVTVTVGGQTAQTNEQGYYSISSVPVGAGAVVNFVASGYVQATELVEVREGQATFLDARMAAVEASAPINGSAGGNVNTPDPTRLGAAFVSSFRYLLPPGSSRRRKRRSIVFSLLEQSRPRGRRRERQNQKRGAVEALRAKRVVVEILVDRELEDPDERDQQLAREETAVDRRGQEPAAHRGLDRARPALQALLERARPALGVGHAEQEADQRPVERRVARVELCGDPGELEHRIDRLCGRPHIDLTVEALERIVEQRVEHTALRAEQIVGGDEADLGLLRETAHGEVGAARRADEPPRGVEDLLAPLAPLLLSQSHNRFEFYKPDMNR